jgi:hypothetical protein
VSEAPSIALGHLFDDAGLFPPARKDLATAVSDHRGYREGPNDWMVGRFLLPVSQLQAFESTRRPADDWELSVVAGTTLDRGAGALGPELAQMAGPLSIGGLEMRLPARPPRPGDLGDLLEVLAAIELPHPIEVWLEVPLSDAAATREWPAAIAAAGALPDSVRSLGAKIRCGGLEPSAFPSVARLAEFLDATDAAGVSFKATAGLHHPFPTPDPEIGVLQHGFIGLLGATGVSGADRAAALEADAEAFEFNDSELRVGDTRLDHDDLRAVRSRFVAIGSCSLTEPVEGLVAHGVLDRDAVMDIAR